jgi:hypothetical protein
VDTHRRTARRRSWVALGVAATVAIAGASGCTFSKGDPYGDLPPAPAAETVLENINLAAYGLRSYPCDLFEASVARCYRPDHWLSIREGGETLARVHRELVGAGGRFWGGPDSLVKADRPTVAGLNLGCYFDYETRDLDLRVAIVGPTGEAAPCVNGLPGDGVSEVWIIGGNFDPADVYSSANMALPFELLLVAVPGPPSTRGDVYGGTSSTVDGYYGLELPARPQGAGVKLLPETVSVRDGIVRGLVQYRGAASIRVPSPSGPESPSPVADAPPEEEKGGAVGVVIGLGTSRYPVPIIIRPGESVPFELPLPAGFSPEDLKVIPGWISVDDTWRGAQLVSGPAVDPACSAGPSVKGEPIAGLVPGAGQSCYVAFAQATMAPGTAIFADAMVAVFDTDGMVVDVIQPYLIRGDGSLAGQGRLMTNDNDLRLAWVDASGTQDGAIGIWVRYARGSEMVLGGAGDPAAAAAAVAATVAVAEPDDRG